MITFTLELSGRPVACFFAEDVRMAEDMTDEPWFCTDLMSLQADGEPLWDGNSEMRLREATLDETATVQERIHASELAGKPFDQAETIFYLVPTSDVMLEDVRSPGRSIQ